MRIRLAALVAVLLFPAYGTRAADPPAEAAGGGEEQEVAQRLLETMVVPQEDIGGLPRGLRVSPESGWKDNQAEARSSLDPDDSAASLRKAGRVTGYELAYYDPTQAAIRSGSGVTNVMTWVDLFTSGDAASAYLRAHVDDALGRAGSSPREGVTFGEVEDFEPGVPGEAYSLRESVDFGGDRVFRTIVVFRRGRLVAGSMVVRADRGDEAADAVRIAGVLDQRIQIALHGGSNGEPVLVPEDGVPWTVSSRLRSSLRVCPTSARSPSAAAICPPRSSATRGATRAHSRRGSASAAPSARRARPSAGRASSRSAAR